MGARWSDVAPYTPPPGLRGVVARRSARPPRPGSTRWITAVTAVLAAVPVAAHYL